MECNIFTDPGDSNVDILGAQYPIHPKRHEDAALPVFLFLECNLNWPSLPLLGCVPLLTLNNSFYLSRNTSLEPSMATDVSPKSCAVPVTDAGGTFSSAASVQCYLSETTE